MNHIYIFWGGENRKLQKCSSSSSIRICIAVAPEKGFENKVLGLLQRNGRRCCLNEAQIQQY